MRTEPGGKRPPPPTFRLLLFVFLLNFEILGVCDPLEVAPQVFLNLLLLSQLSEVATSFCFFSLL